MRLCTSCVAHPALKKYIEDNGVAIPTCDICEATNVKILAEYPREFRQLFKALIRYFHSEWEYNEHFGGDYLTAIFYRPSKIINWREDIDELALESAILPLIDKVYEDDDEGISLFAGYHESGMYNFMLEAIGEKSHHDLGSLQIQLQQKNFFLLESDAKLLITKLEPEITKEIPVNECFYRARIGYSLRGRPDDWGSNPKPDYLHYSGSEIGAAPPTKCSAGRMNRQGTSFLYLASSIETAIAEVKPYPGQPISIGKFQATVPLRIADFSDIDFLKFSDCDDKLDDLHLIAAIDKIFREPIPEDNRVALYCLPQLFSDVLRQMGYDAIKFNSSVAAGTNLTIYDSSKFRYLPDEAAVHIVQEMKYFTEPQKIMSNPKHYRATQKYGSSEWSYNEDL